MGAERYSVQSELGEGRLGAVFRAHDVIADRSVAFQWLPGLGGSREAEQRFLAAAQAAMAVRHPNLVEVLDAGIQGGIPYLVLELLEGESLMARMERGALAAMGGLSLLHDAMGAVLSAQAAGMLHRDLRPSSLFVARDERRPLGVIKVLDLALSQLTPASPFGARADLRASTPQPHALEQRALIVSFGAIAYRLLTGEAPFPDTSSSQLALELATHAPASPTMLRRDLPRSADNLVMRAFAHDGPHSRPDAYESLAEFHAELGAVLSSRSFHERIARSERPGAGARDGSEPWQRTEIESWRVREQRMLRSEPESGSGTRPTRTSQRPDPSSTLDPPSVIFSEVAKPSRPLGLWLAAAFALTGITGLFLLNDLHLREPSAAHPVSAPLTAPSPASAQAASVAQEVMVKLSTTPAGAMVIVDDHAYGPTPTSVVLTGDAAAQGRVVTFRFVHEDFRDLVITRVLGGPRLQIDAPPMQPKPSSRRAAR